MKDLLALRKSIKKKKPGFVRQDAHKKPRLKKKWRRARGIHSKIRLKKRGYRKNVRKGYGSPNKVYGLHPEGLKGVVVKSLDDLKSITKEKGAVISANIGLKKKIELLKKAKELGIIVLNFKDIDKFLKSSEEKQKARKKAKEERKKKKAAKKKEKEKKVEEKKKEEKLAEKLTDEEKKEKEKEEKDKILTKKET